MRQKVAISALISFGTLGILYVANAYSQFSTHPALTDEVVDFFNARDKHGRVISPELKSSARKGSINEDTPPRWVNHFYDPQSGEGWTGEKWGHRKKEQIQALTNTFVTPGYVPLSSVSWAQDSTAQAEEFAVYGGDHSWQKALHDYVDGDKKRAFESIGHILHLLEDSTVPAHTRNDSHPHILGDPGSPYERWAKQVTDSSDLHTAENLIDENLDIPIFQNIKEAFDYTALYSNENFFSEETIGDARYNLPFVNYFENRVYATYFFRILGSAKMPLYKIPEDSNIPTINDPLILSPYFTLLSRRAVLGGAGMIDLFFREAEKLRKDPKHIADPASPSVFAIAKNSIISPAGEGFRVSRGVNALKDGVRKIKNGIANIFSRGSTVADNSASIAVPADNIVIRPSPTPQPEIPEVVAETEQITVPILQGDNTEDTQEIIEPEIKKPIVEIQDEIVEPPPPIESFGPKFSVSSPGFGGGGAPQPVSEPEPVAEEIVIPADTTPPDAPIVTSPSSTSTPFLTDTITFSGTAEASSTISIYRNADISALYGTTTAGDSGVWQTDLALSQGTTTVSFYATDESGNTSSSTTLELFVDSIAPDISLSISECGDSLAGDGCLVATTTISVSWGSSASDTSVYELSYSSPDRVATTTTATSTRITLDDNMSHEISVRARDTSGNWSQAQTALVDIFSLPVVINEIAWAGTRASSFDEWIELFNPTSKVIPLEGWTLYAIDGTPYITLSKSIAPNDYYVIERTDDTTVSSREADLVTAFSGVSGSGLENTGETLVLSRASTTIDTTAVNFLGKWPAGNTSKLTMERVSPNRPGYDADNWRSSSQILARGLDADGARITGTPGTRNSANYEMIPSTISEDLMLTKSNSPYLINNRSVVVKDGAKLTIDPGVVLKFISNAKLAIYGTLDARGDVDNNIVFTSFYDDYGGDLNNDATSSSPTSGDWFGVEVYDTASPDTVFDNVIIRYGGKWYNGGGYKKANLYVEDVPITITNSVFESSAVYGLRLVDSNAIVRGNIFRGNDGKRYDGSIDRFASGLNATLGEPTIENNTASGNYNGFVFKNLEGVVKNNTVVDNDVDAIQSDGLVPTFGNNTASGNGINGIVLSGTLTSLDASSTLYADAIPYVLRKHDAAVSASSTLTVDSGVVVKAFDSRLFVNGRLEINGSDEDNIVFTALQDGSVGGDTDGLGASSTPMAGAWGGIMVQNNGSITADWLTLKYAGGKSFRTGNYAGISLNRIRGATKISNSIFDSNYPHAISAGLSGPLTLTNVMFKNDRETAPWGIKSSLLTASNATTTLNNVVFKNNLLGVRSADTPFVVSSVNFVDTDSTTTPPNIW